MLSLIEQYVRGNIRSKYVPAIANHIIGRNVSDGPGTHVSISG